MSDDLDPDIKAGTVPDADEPQEDELEAADFEEDLGEEELDDEDSESAEDAEDDDDAEEPAAERAKGPTTGDEEGEDEEEEPHPDDVEADLDTILKDRLVVEEDEEDEEEELPGGVEERAAGTKVRPRGSAEFVCQSCFLVKNHSQLADAERLLCRDCV